MMTVSTYPSYQNIHSNPSSNALYKMSELKNDLKQINKILDKNTNNNTFGNEDLAKELRLSHRQLFRKIKSITNLSPQKYIRYYRLQQAMTLMIVGKYKTVNEVAYAIGYSNVGYFIRQFEKEFGKKPLQILQENGWR